MPVHVYSMTTQSACGGSTLDISNEGRELILSIKYKMEELKDH